MADVDVNDFDLTDDPEDKTLYIVTETGDFKIPFNDFLGSVIKSNGNVSVGVGTNIINFTKPFKVGTTYSLIIYDFNGLGIQEITRTILGFEIESLGAGIIGYVAIKNF